MARSRIVPAALAVVAAAAACSDSNELQCPSRAPPVEAHARRLTTREYVRVLNDVFVGIKLPFTDETHVIGGKPPARGFENDVELQVESPLYTEDAFETARLVGRLAAEQLDPLSACPDGDRGKSCVTDYLYSKAKLLWRRPLTADEAAALQGLFDDVSKTDGPQAAFAVAIEALLASPDFLYRIEPPTSDDADGEGRVKVPPLELASRLSFFLWGSVPDDELLDAAVNGQLATADGVTAQVRRMLSDDRGTRQQGDFHRQWLDARMASPEATTLVGNGMGAALAEEMRHYVGRVFAEKGTLDYLFTSTSIETNGALAPVYGLHVSGDAWQQVTLDGRQRAGILSLASFLAARSVRDHPSPIMRGDTVITSVLCQPVGAPPASVLAFLSDEPTPPNPTNRQKYEAQTGHQPCSTCHLSMNAVGYAFESFDQGGQFRTTDNGRPVDASGDLKGTDVDGHFSNSVQLAGMFAHSRQVSDCYVRHWLQFASGRTSDACEAKPVADAFAAANGDLRKLVELVATSDAMLYRKAGQPAGGE